MNLILRKFKNYKFKLKSPYKNYMKVYVCYNQYKNNQLSFHINTAFFLLNIFL